MRDATTFNNILELFFDRVENLKDKPYLWERINSEWQPISWENAKQYVLHFASALKERGHNDKDAVSILSSNIKEWPLCDLAVILANGISVGLYPTSSNVQSLYMINHSESKFVIVDSENQLNKILSIKKDINGLIDIIVVDPNVPSDINKGIWNIKDYLILGKESVHKYENKLMDNVKKMSLEDIIIYVYTSGTTGDPKAAMLSNRYMIYNSDSIQKIFNFSPDDRIMSFLPFCHVGERVFGFGNSLVSGRQTYMVPNFNDLFQYVHEVNPTIFGGVPRIYEKFHSTIVSYINSLSNDKKNEIYNARQETLKYYQMFMNGETIDNRFRDKIQEYDDLYFRQLREMVLGKAVKVCTSGAAPLAKHISRDFLSIGLIIYEAYGLTENICVSFNRPNKFKIGTVGIPMPYTEVKLSEENEIMVSGKNLFSGYYKNQQATDDMFDKEKKWIYTGDIGEIDSDGFLKIVDRKKDIIITSTGKNIAPSIIENLLKTNPIISQAMIVGDGKSYISALITINPLIALKKYQDKIVEISKDVIEKYLKGESIDIDLYQILSKSQVIFEEIKKFIDEVNQQLNRTEQIKKFLILPFDFSIERNEITPTLKLKRKEITKKYSNFIEQLYHEEK